MSQKRLRVGLDYLTAVSHAPGVGRYCRELVRAAVPLQEGPTLSLFEWGRGPRPMEGPPLGLEAARLQVRRRRYPLPRRTLAWSRRWLRLGADDLCGGVDVFHRILPGQPPLRRAPAVQPVAELPARDSPGDQHMGQALRSAAASVVFCADYAAEIPRRYGVDPERVFQVTVGSEHWLRDAAAQAPVAVAETAEPARILVLGAIRHERRPLLALAGFEHFRAGGGQGRLCLVGRPAAAADELRSALARSPVASDVEWIDDPIEAQMPGLVSGSATLLHLAENEGSPVTPLEACAMGLSVAAERLPAFEEALGKLAAWIPRDPGPEQVADALQLALGLHQSDPHRSSRKACAAQHTWTECAEQHFRIWAHVASKGPFHP